MDLNKINYQMSENRQALNGEDLSAEDREKLLRKQNDLEVQYRNLLKEEENKKRPVPQSLHQRARLGKYIRAAGIGGNLSGAELELNKELNIPEDRIPLNMFLNRDEEVEKVEHRVDVATNIPADVGPTRQNNIISRLFKRSDSMWLGVKMPSVPTGSSNWPLLSIGSQGNIANKGTAVDAEAATITKNTITPKRFVTRYVISSEDLATIENLEDALRMDMRMRLMELMDDQIISGDGTGANFTGILSSTSNFFGTNPSNIITFAGLTSSVLAEIDGLSSYAESDVGIMIAPDTLRYLAGNFSEAQGGSATLQQWVRESGVRYRVSSRIPGHTNANIASILRVEFGPVTEAYAPVWDSASMIRDIYSNASKGEIGLTLSALCGWSIVRSGYTGTKWKVA